MKRRDVKHDNFSALLLLDTCKEEVVSRVGKKSQACEIWSRLGQGTQIKGALEMHYCRLEELNPQF